MKKVLFCASTASHITNFHLPYVRFLKEHGYEVHTAAKGKVMHEWIDKSYGIAFSKRFYSLQNIKAIFQLCRILKKEQYALLSTHAMLAGVVGRFAVMLSRVKTTKVLHTSHGYLFEDNGSLKAKFMLLIEKWLARYTDVLLVMNQHDCTVAHKYHLADNIAFIDGMGIDTTKFPPITPQEVSKLRNELQIASDDFVFLYAGEFSERKNQAMLMKAFQKAHRACPNIKLILLGEGKLLPFCKRLANELQLQNAIYFGGYVTEMNRYYRLADAVVSTSKSEGLPFNIMEALVCNVPIIASKVKGHVDLIKHEQNGLLFDIDDMHQLESQMVGLVKDTDLYQTLKSKTFLKEKYTISLVQPVIENIYRNLLNEQSQE